MARPADALQEVTEETAPLICRAAPQALLLRKASLARLLKRPVDGIFIAEYEQGDIGDVLFRVAHNMGLEGIVSKRLDCAYSAGKCNHWIKIKNPAHPACSRVRDALIRARQPHF